jgi:serine phosphatase RsbU (regulator of sigma subunit)
MITETDITTCSQNQTAPVHVLFVGNRLVSDELTEQLNGNGYLWDQVASGDFNSCIHSRNILGTVIFDAGAITTDNAAVFQELFKQLDQKDISIIIHNCPDFIQLDDLPLASKITSVDYAPLWARIESNVKIYKRLQRDLAEKDAHTCQLSVNEDTARQLEMAGHVQRNFLPTRLPHAGNIRWATMFRPAEWVSGDIYDIARLDEEHIGFYLADAVGHSMPAALLTMFLKQAAVMRQTINDNYTIFKPWEVITTLNLRMSEQELAGCLFATCFYGLLNIKTLQLNYARAGHPYPVLIRDDQFVQLQSRGGLLGVFPEADFEQKSIQLQPGDKLFVFSDGAEPIIGASDDDGQFHFNEAFTEICRLPIEPMIEALSNTAKEYHFKPGEIDDVTAVAMEIL